MSDISDCTACDILHGRRTPPGGLLLREAEGILLEDLPILPIYAYASKNLVDPRLGGFFENALDEHPPKSWFWTSR